MVVRASLISFRKIPPNAGPVIAGQPHSSSGDLRYDVMQHPFMLKHKGPSQMVPCTWLRDADQGRPKNTKHCSNESPRLRSSLRSPVDSPIPYFLFTVICILQGPWTFELWPWLTLLNWGSEGQTGSKRPRLMNTLFHKEGIYRFHGSPLPSFSRVNLSLLASKFSPEHQQQKLK